MKRTILILPLLFAALLFSGCTDGPTVKADPTIKNQLVFRGGNALWNAEYRVNGEGRFTVEDGQYLYDSWSDEGLVVFYKGDISELSDIKDLKISYRAGSSAGYIQMSELEGGPHNKVFRLGSGGNGAMIGKDATVTITVSLDGKAQSFELNNETSISDRLGFMLKKSPLEQREEMEKQMQRQ